MLRHLRVTNFAILSDVALDLGDGLNVLTGETGAGKSLIVEAVNLLRGGRASADIPRAGATEAVVEAIFEIPPELRARIGAHLAASGCDVDDEVVVRRVIQRGGRSRTWVNGALTTAGRLAELGALLVDLSGQHQHQGLVDPGRHRDILDLFGVDPALGAEMAAAWQAVATIDLQIAELGGDERARRDRAAYLRFQLDELDAARPEAGEEARLEAERIRLAAIDQLAGGARLAEELVYGGDASASDRLAAAARELDRLARIDAALDGCARQIGEARALADDAAATLRHYADRLEGDPERLAWVDDRLSLLRRLTRKHGGVDLCAHAEALRAELDALDHRDERLAALDDERVRARARAGEAAQALTAARSRAARRLEREVGAALVDLGMASARLGVRIAPRELGPGGADEVELMLASNKGEEARPLAKIASGGELSRIMLAAKLVLRRADQVATYVFDEVDSGIGGTTATVVGRQIRGVADDRQVLCVTHLPQIAAFADVHFHVEKHEARGRTETTVKKLTASARKEELARMLGGTATARARAHAAELLDEARTRAASR
jgi:DNA repair protein RecN (Recombination protein N)